MADETGRRGPAWRLGRRTALKGAAATAGLAAWNPDLAWSQPAPATPLDPAAPVTPASAFATHAARMVDLAKDFASTDNRCDLNRYRGQSADEDALAALIAHCHALTADDGFARPGSEPSRTMVPAVLRSMNRGTGLMGTPTAFHPHTNYDPTVRGLVVLARRYRTQITEAGYDKILNELFPAELVGGHPEDIEVVELANGNLGEGKSLWSKIEGVLAGAAAGAVAGGIIGAGAGAAVGAGAVAGGAADAVASKMLRVPETENHLLMIESSRYIINQMRREKEPNNPKYDNAANGLRDWLLRRMAVVAQHDFLEFNSRPYARYSLLALMNLHEFAADEVIRTGAQHLLDYTMMKFAVSSSRGRRVTPFRRQQYRINHAQNVRNDMWAGNTDEVAGMFLAYTGSTTPTGTPGAFPGALRYNGVLAGTAPYRPPPAAYAVALDPAVPGAVHRFFHGIRPQLPASPDTPESGLEIYAKSPSFLLTAGGSFLNSGYGRDEINIPDVGLLAWKQASRAQATTLIPSRQDVAFHDLLRFEPYPDPQVDPLSHADGDVDDEHSDNYHTASVNTGVHAGLMAGANLRPAEKRTVDGRVVRTAQAMTVHNGTVWLAWMSWKDRGLLFFGAAQVTNAMSGTKGDRIDGVEGVQWVAGIEVRQDDGKDRDDPPALASFSGHLVAAWTDNHTNNLHLGIYDPDHRTLPVSVRLDDTSEHGPSLAVHAGQLFLAWTGTGEGKLNLARVRIDPALNPTPGPEPARKVTLRTDREVMLADSSEAAPALAAHAGRLYLAWQGTGENKLNIMVSDDGARFGGKKTYEETSKRGPCLASHAGALHLAWRGDDAKLNLCRIVTGPGGPGAEDGKVRLGESSDAAPAIASIDDLLVLSWQGTGDNLLNLRASLDLRFAPWSGWRVVDRSDIGLFFAAYRTPADKAPSDKPAPLENLGFVFVVESADMARRGIAFPAFAQAMRSGNAHLPARLAYGGTYNVLTPDDRRYTIWFQSEGEKYRARVTETHQFLADFSDGGLVSGRYMVAPNKHDGLLEIRFPGAETSPVVLDFRDPLRPKRDDAKDKLPAPWNDRATALLAASDRLARLGRTADAKLAREQGLALQAEMARFTPNPAQPSTQPAGPDATIRSLAGIGVDFSVSAAEMKDWLGNPDFTPYPAIAQVLLASGWRFKSPVFLDVIVGFYEQTRGVSSPRKAADVRPEVLRAAILAASNERYSASVPNFDSLLRP